MIPLFIQELIILYVLYLYSNGLVCSFQHILFSVMIFNCHIFNRSGKRIFYREYNRTYNAFEKSPEEESKLICGFLLSMNAILEKFSHEK